jgi:hypothetical protein
MLQGKIIIENENFLQYKKVDHIFSQIVKMMN